MVVDEVVVKLRAQVEDYKRRLADAESHSTRVFSRIRVGAGALKTTLSGLGPGLGAGLLGAAGVAGLVELGRMFLSVADKGKQLTATLKLASGQFGDFGRAQADVRRIAMATRTDLEGTARLYSTFLRSANELGITQREAARATETVSKAFLVSGASSVEAAQGTRQLVQAIQSGVLRGDEFNTIMESAPRLARLFAEALGVPVKQLRSLAEQGKITAQNLLDALTKPKFVDPLDKEFAKLPLTFEQAMTQVENAALITFSAFDRGGEFSNMIAAFVNSGAESFEELEYRAEVMGGNLRATISALYNVFDPMGANAVTVMDLIGDAVNGLRMLIAGTLRDLQNLYNVVPGTANLIRKVGRAGGFTPLGIYPVSFGADSEYSTIADDFQKKLKQQDLEAARRRTGNINTGQAHIAEFGYESDRRGRFVPTPPKSTKAKKGAADKAEREAQRAEREQERFQAELERLQGDLLAAKAAQAVAADDVYNFAVQEVEREREAAKAAIDRDATGKNKRYDALQAEQLKALQDQVADAKLEKLAADRRVALQEQALEVNKAQLTDQMDIAKSQQRFLRTREAQRDAALNLLDLEYDMLRLELEAVLASEKSTDAQKKIAEERLRILGTLKANDERAINEEHRSPGQQYLADLEVQSMNLNDELESLAVDKVRELAAAFGEATAAAFGLHGILGDLVAKVAELYFQEALLLPLMRQLFGGGGNGGILGGLASLFGGSTSSAAGATPTPSGIVGPRAGGGPVYAGQAYRVGEHGQETFVPNQSGMVVPGGGQAAYVEVAVVANDYFDARVTKVTGPVIAQASTIAVQGGASLAKRDLAKQQLHHLG